MTKILFVCLGNICRSPTAHGVFEGKLKDAALPDIEIESAGTGSWHVGDPPDERAIAAALSRGYDLSYIRARQVKPTDFEYYDYILAMDKDNLRNLRAMAPRNHKAHLALFLSYAQNPHENEVPDPYYGGADGFDYVLDLVEAASEGLLEHLCAKA